MSGELDTTSRHGEPVGEKAGAREWVGLAVLMLPVLLISVDMTVLGFAVPYLSGDLGPTGPQLLWIVDIYSFLLAGLLVTMGSVGDRIGRRRLLMLGAAGFGVASLLCAYAPNTPALIAGRALLGVAGATLMPSTLSLLRNMFLDERQRLFALATWGSAFSVGTALGPILGGWLLEQFWWGSVFLINLPVTVVALVATPLLVRESRDPSPGRFDLLSVVLSLVAILPMVYAVKSIAEDGVRVVPVVLIGLGLLVGYAFVRRQRTLLDPMIDVSLFRVRGFSTAIGTEMLVIFAVTAALLLVPQYLQLVQGESPLRAGLLLLPGAVLAMAAGFLAAAATRRLGVRTLIAAGLVSAAAGYATMIWLPPSRAVMLPIVAFALLSFGEGLVMTLTNSTILTAVSPERAGAASAISETAIELGGALGVAVLGSVATAVYQAKLTAVLGVSQTGMDAARETLAGAMVTAADVGGTAGEALASAARAAFTDALHLTSAVGAVLLFYAAVQVWILLRQATRSPHPADKFPSTG